MAFHQKILKIPSTIKNIFIFINTNREKQNFFDMMTFIAVLINFVGKFRICSRSSVDLNCAIFPFFFFCKIIGFKYHLNSPTKNVEIRKFRSVLVAISLLSSSIICSYSFIELKSINISEAFSTLTLSIGFFLV